MFSLYIPATTIAVLERSSDLFFEDNEMAAIQMAIAVRKKKYFLLNIVLVFDDPEKIQSGGIPDWSGCTY